MNTCSNVWPYHLLKWKKWIIPFCNERRERKRTCYMSEKKKAKWIKEKETEEKEKMKMLSDTYYLLQLNRREEGKKKGTGKKEGKTEKAIDRKKWVKEWIIFLSIALNQVINKIFIIKGFQTTFFIFIVISSTFRPIWPPAFFKGLSNSGTYTELWTTSFIEFTGGVCSDSINHNQVLVLSIPILLLACSQDWTCNHQIIVSLEA